jgi:ADP-heptose:LPS heptosyltransferase
MATPLAAAVRATWPETVLEWAVDRHSRPALSGNPHVDGLVDATGVVRGALEMRAVARLARTTRGRGYDLVLVPDRSALLALLALASGASRRVGLDSGGRGWPYTVRVPADGVRHETDVYLGLARAIGLAPVGSAPVFVPSASDRALASAALGAAPASGPMVAIHPGGGVNPGMALVEKRWPVDRFAELIHRLVAELDATVVLLGGTSDLDVTAEVLARTEPGVRDRIVDVAGRLDLGATAAAIEACRLFIGNDSGVAHLAAAVGTPTVVLFGPTDPRRYGPQPGLGTAVTPLGWEPVDRLSQAQASPAIQAVATADVWRAAEEWLHRRPA